MPRRFFRRFALKRTHLKEQWFLAPFDHLLHDPNLWGIRRRSVTPAVALGVFIAFLPFPGHFLLAAVLAVLMRVNIPVAVLATLLVNNPVTMAPIYYVAFEVGGVLLGLQPQPFEFEPSIEWVLSGFVQIWKPLLLGCLLLGTFAAMLTYVALDLVWRASVAAYLARRRARTPLKGSRRI